MKYLKYFESNIIHSSIKEDIEDICLELSDIGFEIYVVKENSMQYDFGKPIYIIQISKKLDEETLSFAGDNEYFNYSDVEEVIERIKDYLGNRFICLDYPGIADGGDTLSKPLNFLEIYFKP